MTKSTAPSRHFSERGGGYDMPLLMRQIETKPAETIVIGGEPHQRRYSGLSLVRGSSTVDNVEYAYEQLIRVWTCERRELLTEGLGAPMVVEYGFWTHFKAWYWSKVPDPTGAANESRLRAANRDLSLIDLYPTLATASSTSSSTASAEPQEVEPVAVSDPPAPSVDGVEDAAS